MLSGSVAEPELFLRLRLRLFRKLRLHSGSGSYSGSGVTCYKIFYDKGKWYQ